MMNASTWRSRPNWALAIIVGVTVMVACALVLRSIERSLLSAAELDGGIAERADVANVELAVRRMDLITVALETTATARASDESWRGSVEASVSVPVRLLYGVDLSRARVERAGLASAGIDAITRAVGERVIITLPPPTRIASEINPRGLPERASVDVGWARTRTRAGEYYLGRARQDLPGAVGALALSDQDAARVRDETAQRVRTLALAMFSRGDAGRAAQIDIDIAFDPALGAEQQNTPLPADVSVSPERTP
jgi:hypothetical protein